MCHTPIGQAKLLCAECFSRLTFISAPYCHACALPWPTITETYALTTPEETTSSYLSLSQPCPYCHSAPTQWHEARAVLLYDAFAKNLILPLKYSDKTELAPFLANLIFQAGKDLFSSYDAIIPVPLHNKRLRQRYYNQAALIGQCLSKISGLPFIADGLVRIKNTPTLEALNRSERSNIMKNSIAINPKRRKKLISQKIILLDDVMTTGATLTACCSALNTITPFKPSVFVVARTPPAVAYKLLNEILPS